MRGYYWRYGPKAHQSFCDEAPPRDWSFAAIKLIKTPSSSLFHRWVELHSGPSVGADPSIDGGSVKPKKLEAPTPSTGALCITKGSQVEMSQ
jgi:hypothetical protein